MGQKELNEIWEITTEEETWGGGDNNTKDRLKNYYGNLQP